MRRVFLTLAFVAGMGGAAYGMGMGIGIGLNDLRHGKPGAQPVGCTTFVTDYSVSCNLIVATTTGLGL